MLKIRIATVALTLAACSQPAPKPAATAVPETQPSTSSGMLDHWVLITEVRDAVIAGKLDRVTETASRLVTLEPPEPTPPTEILAELRQHAAEAKSAMSLQEASVAAASLGATCGKCHTAAGADVQFTPGPAPPQGDDPRSHMQRHVWAANAMWEGLVGPSTGRWEDGAGVLAERPIHETADPSEFVVTPEVTRLAEAAHNIGIRAHGVTEPAERAAIYGEFIGLCAECHGQTQQGPQ